VANSIIYIADRIFTGQEWLEDHAILVEENLIKDVMPSSSLPENIPKKVFPGCSVAPAFIDLQIYGAYGKLLAAYPEAGSLFKLSKYCRKGGAVFCLPTIATNKAEVFHRSIDAVKDYWKQGGKGVLGLHTEGPWINPVKRGAHIESLIHSPSLKEAEELLNYGKGVIKMITLAPEVCSKEIIDLILSHNIIISAGHSNATYNEAIQGFENGITTVTHLYNAMSSLRHRAPGLVGATLDHSSVMSSIIPDGHHVDYVAIRIAKQIMKERLFAITDAVTETEMGYYRHQLADDKYESDGILSGSALTMNKALQNLVYHCGIELAEALRMCSFYPAQVIKLDKVLGKIEKSYQAKLVVLDQDLNSVTVLPE
jgi:N-acetylglucosamine-6-phosphate deacetylase